jgi:hypothetical protein
METLERLDADELAALLPSLSHTLSLLRALLDRPSPPDFLYIHAPHNTRLVSKVLIYLLQPIFSPPCPASSGNGSSARRSKKAEKPPHIQRVLRRLATVDCVELHSPKILYDRVLNVLSGWEGSAQGWDDGVGGVENWDGRLEGAEVTMKKRGGKSRTEERTRKRPRLDSDAEDDEDGGGDLWTVEWDRSVPRAHTGKGVLTQRKDESFDAFCDGLRSIFELGGERPDGEEDLDRLLLFEHAERLALGFGENQALEGIFLSSLTRLGQMASILSFLWGSRDCC